MSRNCLSLGHAVLGQPELTGADWNAMGKRGAEGELCGCHQNDSHPAAPIQFLTRHDHDGTLAGIGIGLADFAGPNHQYGFSAAH